MPRNQQQKNKAAGTWAETQVATYLARWWPLVERRRLSGQYDRGDITGIADTVVEVKNEKKINLSGYLAELDTEMLNDDAGRGAVIIRKRGTTDVGQWYAVMNVDQLVALWRIEGCNHHTSDN